MTIFEKIKRFIFSLYGCKQCNCMFINSIYSDNRFAFFKCDNCYSKYNFKYFSLTFNNYKITEYSVYGEEFSLHGNSKEDYLILVSKSEFKILFKTEFISLNFENINNNINDIFNKIVKLKSYC